MTQTKYSYNLKFEQVPNTKEYKLLMTVVKRDVRSAKLVVEKHLKKVVDPDIKSKNETRLKIYVQQYTAAFAVNFTDWIGKTLPWVRSPEAKFALLDNLRCEQEEDHVGMLEHFALQCDALPQRSHYVHVYGKISLVRELFRDVTTAGLHGLVVLSVLENTSEIFIPRLEEIGKVLGCRNLKYTEVHGVADAEHSKLLLKASEAEAQMGYPDQNIFALRGLDRSIQLIRRIFTIE